MLLVLSGEGASDMGGLLGDLAKPGPMAHIADSFVKRKFDFSPLEAGLARWVTRAELSAVARNEKLPITLPGRRRSAEYAGYTKQAAALAFIAVQYEQEEGDSSVAVFFRDSDGTNSSPHDHWERVVSAVRAGFASMEFARGVAMVPKPKQEAWLLCAMKQDPYVNCAALEEYSGNDGAPSSLKGALAASCGFDPQTDHMNDWILDGSFDIEKIDMPSFSAFVIEMEAALDALRS